MCTINYSLLRNIVTLLKFTNNNRNNIVSYIIKEVLSVTMGLKSQAFNRNIRNDYYWTPKATILESWIRHFVVVSCEMVDTMMFCFI
ncbi:hypothetical protein V1478_014363 [Vespula squamosa]|uniref:Uncharacterized protein n=1 Tax=Vespula squamosa TaxID=30214 RepID=A0ABD2A7T0_VESSQ